MQFGDSYTSIIHCKFEKLGLIQLRIPAKKSWEESAIVVINYYICLLIIEVLFFFAI